MGSFSTEVIRVGVFSLALFAGSLAVGIPIGFFQTQLSASFGAIGTSLLADGMSAILTALIGFYFAARWPKGAFARTTLSFVLVELLSLLASQAGDTHLPPVSLLLAITMINWGFALAGCALGKRAIRAGT